MSVGYTPRNLEYIDDCYTFRYGSKGGLPPSQACSGTREILTEWGSGARNALGCRSIVFDHARRHLAVETADLVGLQHSRRAAVSSATRTRDSTAAST